MYHLHSFRCMHIPRFVLRNKASLRPLTLYVNISGHKAKRLVLQCFNGVSSNPVEREQKCVSPKI